MTIGDDEEEYWAQAVRRELDELSSAVGDLAPRLSGVERRVASTEQSAGRVERRSVEAESASRSLAAQVARLSARVEWLERNLRRRGADELQLDDVPSTLREFAAAAEAGRDRADRLLSAADRTALEATVTAHEEVTRRLESTRRTAIEAAGVLVGTGWQEPSHRTAAREFAAAAATHPTLQEETARLARPAREARADLAADDRARNDADAVLAAGEQAWQQLLTGLHERLADAVADAALLPEWFVGPLGPTPPGAPQAAVENWFDLGTELLAYRVTYAVGDPVLPLGPPPSTPTDDRGRRLAWFRRLTRRIDDLSR